MGFSAVFQKPSQSPTKEIVVGNGGYYADASVTAIGSINGSFGNCTALVTSKRHKIPVTGLLIGAVIVNTTGTTSGTIAGEGAGASTLSYYGKIHKAGATSTRYPLYADKNNNDRVLTLGANTFGDMMLAQAIPVEAGDYYYSQVTVEAAATTDTIIRGMRYDYSILNEGYKLYNDATPANNVTSARSDADAGLTSGFTAGNSGSVADSVTDNAFGVLAVAGLIMLVENSVRVFEVWGDSRAVGGTAMFAPSEEGGARENDSFIAAALEELGLPYIMYAKGSARGYQDLDDEFGGIRRAMSRGVTDVLNAHGQNDLANTTISEYQQAQRDFYTYNHALGRKVWAFTIDPWVLPDGGPANTHYWKFNGASYTVGDATTSTERTKVNAWLRGSRDGTCTDGDSTIILSEICDGVIDSADAVENSSNRTQWKQATTLTTGTLTSATTTLGADTSQSPEYGDYIGRLVVTLTAADVESWGIVRGNNGSGTSQWRIAFAHDGTNQVSTWSTGATAPGVGKLYTIYNTYTNDGLHASFYGNRQKQAVVEAFFR